LFSGLFHRDQDDRRCNFQRLVTSTRSPSGGDAVYLTRQRFNDGFDFTAGTVASSRQRFL
jgi:hypothetical protein